MPDGSNYRSRCLKAKKEECIVCGVTDDILVHHVDGDRSNNTLSNLIPVCSQCHSKIHAKHKSVAKWVRKLGYEPKSEERTTIQVTHETWRNLNVLKQGPSDDMDDVIRRLLELSNR